MRPPLAAAAAAAAAKAMGSIIEGSVVEGVLVDAVAVDDVLEREEDLWVVFDDDRRASSEILAVLPLVTSDDEDEGVFDRLDFECLVLDEAKRERCRSKEWSAVDEGNSHFDLSDSCTCCCCSLKAFMRNPSCLAYSL